MPSLLHRLTAWLCLALACVCGLTPAQGFVLCIEGDGCVSIEVKAADGDCAGCGGHEDEGARPEEAPVQDACPCVDLAVPGEPPATKLGSRVAPRHELTLAASVLASPLVLPAPERAAATAPPCSVPRAHPRLAALRTVVLRV